MITKVMDHTNYPKALRTKTLQSLRFTIKDAQEALEANPDNPNNGFYQDEINYCANELNRRAMAETIEITKVAGRVARRAKTLDLSYPTF
jgi:hypothetical protein